MRAHLLPWSSIAHLLVTSRCPAVKPRPFGAIVRLECINAFAILLSARNAIQAFEQAFPAHRMNIEAMTFTGRIGDGLRMQIDRNLRARMRAQLHAHRGYCSFGQDDGKQAVFAAVVGENVTEAGRDDAANAELKERVNGALARRAAAKIPVGDENARAAIRLDIQQVLLFAAVDV